MKRHRKLSTASASMQLLLLAPPPAATHPATLQSSASEFPQVESCALLPSLSFRGSAKSNCLGRESRNEAHLCRSDSAEMQTPLGAHDASGRMLMAARKRLQLTTAFFFFFKSWIVCTNQQFILHPNPDCCLPSSFNRNHFLIFLTFISHVTAVCQFWTICVMTA